MLTSYERDVIRPHAMGKFEDLLVATAQSPAMLFYLDNWLSVGPNSDFANGVPKRPSHWNRRRFPRSTPQRQAKGKRGGLNENYGRELMELHTLGVNGGYTQKDVTEVARVFTGWIEGLDGRVVSPSRACMMCGATRLCWGIASNRKVRRKDARCCTFWHTFLRQPGSFAQSWRCALLRTIRRAPWSIAWRKLFSRRMGTCERCSRCCSSHHGTRQTV